MTDLDRYPSLRQLGAQFDAVAAAEVRQKRGVPRLAWAPGRSAALLGATTRLAVLAVVAVIVGGTYAAPVTRAAAGDLFDSLSSWIGGSADAPGRAATPADDLPAWVNAEDGDKRVLASAGGERLVVIRRGTTLTFALADFGTSGTIDDLRKTLAGKKIVLIGAGRFLPDGDHDRRPVFGLVAGAIVRVELNYADGGPAVADDHVRGAFGMTIDTTRRPRSLTAFDQQGRVVGRLSFARDAREQSADEPLGDFRYCPDVTGCPAWAR